MSTESIIKDLPDEFVRQMRNWVAIGSSVGMYAISAAYQGMPNNAVYGPRVPLSGGEATHIERAIEALPNRTRCAVMLFWQYEGNDLVWLGRRLRCDYRTAEVRVRMGHDLMRKHLALSQATEERMRDRQAVALIQPGAY